MLPKTIWRTPELFMFFNEGEKEMTDFEEILTTYLEDKIDEPRLRNYMRDGMQRLIDIQIQKKIKSIRKAKTQEKGR